MKRLLSLSLVTACAVAAQVAVLTPAAPAANTCTVPYCPAPKVETGPAEDVKNTEATLTGIVNSNGSDTTCHFELGTTSGAYTVSSPNITISGNKTGDQGVTADVSGLERNNVYFYRLTCTNLGGTTNGLERAFAAGEVDPNNPKDPNNPPPNNPGNNISTGNGQPTTSTGQTDTTTKTDQPTISAPSSAPASELIAQNALNAAEITTTQVTNLLRIKGLVSLLNSSGFTTEYSAPSAGVFQSDVFALGIPGQAFTAGVSHKFALLARGSHTFTASGSAKVRVKPTWERRLLNHGRRVRVLVRTTFTPTGGKPIVQRKYMTLTLKRR